MPVGKMGKADAPPGGATYSTLIPSVRQALQLVKTKKGAHLRPLPFILFRKDKDGNDEKYSTRGDRYQISTIRILLTRQLSEVTSLRPHRSWLRSQSSPLARSSSAST